MLKLLNKSIRVFYFYYTKNQLLLFLIFFNLKLLIYKKVLPYKLTIKINNNCNLMCSFCNIWKEKETKIIRNGTLDKLFTNYGKHIRILSFTWWEIFLVNDIVKKLLFQ